MDNIDRAIINQLQGGFPICERPFAEISEKLGLQEDQLIQRIEELLNNGVLSRFGPLFNIERMGGLYSLIAMQLPDNEFDRIAGIINNFPEVAHNYEREHTFNMWFVLAVESEQKKLAILEQIEIQTGFRTYDMPKIKEYFVGLKFDA